MKSLLTFFIKYPAWAMVIKILVLLFGLVALLNMKSSFFPELEPNLINISIIYPGASPEEIEQGVIQKIEDNLKGIQGIDRITSSSRENNASILIEAFRNFNIDDVLQDVKNAVDRINSFPAGMEPVVVAKSSGAEFAISFAINGTEDLYTLKNVAKKIEDDLRGLKGISQITITGYPREEIVALIKEENLRRYQLRFDDVTKAVRSSNIELTSGSIKTENEELLIRVQQKNYHAEQMQDIIVRSMADGKVVRLKDIADIVNSWEEIPQKTYVNGKRSVVFTVSKIFGENILQITEIVKKYVEDFNKRNTVVKAEILDDFTSVLRQRIDTLITNGAQGAVLVILSLALFLNLRLSFWVALSIPFSFLGTFLLAYLLNFTVNAISLFGSIIVVGMLVDDGIVISEQIYQNYEKGEKPFVAAIKGAIEVLPSVIFAVLTTIVMFIPFFFMDGRNGANMRDMAFMVIVPLIISLFEAAFLLPSHLAHSKALHSDKRTNKIRLWLDKILIIPRDILYFKSLQFFMKYKLLGIGVIIFVTLITIGGFAGGHIKATFFPFIDNDSFEIQVKMPAGTREHITEQILDKVEKAARDVNTELKKQRADGRDVIIRVVKNVGLAESSRRGTTSTGAVIGASNEGSVQIVLMKGEERNYESYKISNLIRQKVEPVYGAEKMIYGGGSIFGKPVSVSLISPDLNDLENAKRKIRDGLQGIPEIGDITDNDPSGLREIKITLKEKAFLLGLTNLEIARQIRQGYFGDEVQRLQRGNDEIRVWVRYDMDDRSSLGKWEDMRIRLGNNTDIPLSELIDYKIERGRTVINHLDGKREVAIEAELVDQNMEVPPVLAKINETIVNPVLNEFPSVSIAESGQRREIMKMANSARTGLTIAFVIMFFLIVLSFRSYLQAGIVIFLLPFGLIGAFWGHYIQGMPVNIMSGYGIIALIGIFVNNGIVFINTFNDNLKSGMEFMNSITDAALSRFRPILLTTFTTAAGLFPLLAEKSLQAQFLIPMAISVAYGLLIGSFFILVLLPVFLIILNDMRRLPQWLWNDKKLTREEVEHAIIEEEKIKKYLN